MKFYVEKRKHKKKTAYRIVKDATINGIRDRDYFPLPEGTSKAEADEICRRMQLDMEYGTYVPQKPKLFSEYAEEIYFPKYTGELSPTTSQHYMQVYKTEGGLKEKLGNKYLSEITTEILQDMVNCYKAEGKASKTIKNYVNVVSVILKWQRLTIISEGMFQTLQNI